ncbi:MAG: S41 family peptidase [Candidatus Moranbacteria bacterium]|nr:S41 family peptidase [Candidatus Moranbacteria bacterium]
MDIENNNRKSSKFRQHFNYFIVVVLVCASFYGGVFYSQYKAAKNNKTDIIQNLVLENHNKSQPKDVNADLFWEAWNLITEKYVDPSKVDKNKMLYGAISGMVKSLGDPFSSFMNPEESQQFSSDMQGTFEGIGTEIGLKNDILTVIAPIDGTPADQAGLKAGDMILKIDDAVTTDLSVDEAVAKIRGPKGTQVKLTILRDKNGSPKEITITRDTINVKSVKIEFKENNIAVIKISKFGDDTNLEFNKAANEAVSRKASGIILDLRNNPGGYLETAVEAASKFVPKDVLVVAEENRGGQRNEYKAEGGDILKGIPVVVLVNGGSASASEILSGALRDDLGAKLVGSKTFGKGSVQQLEKMTGGSNLRITIARWLTPNGDYIMEKGIEPDVKVDLTDDDYNNSRDPQMDKALEILKGEIK